MEAIAGDEPSQPAATGQAGQHAISSNELDRVLFAALAPLALALLGRQAEHRPADADPLGAAADLLGEQNGPPSPPPPGEPEWPAEPLTHSENRVLQFLPSHMSAQQIAAELA